MSEKDTHEPEQNVTQPARRTKKKKRGKAGRIVRKTVRTVVVLAVIAGAGLFGLKAYIQKQAESSDNESYSRAVVTRGAMEETVYGTGTTSARNQTNVLAGADGTLTDLRVSVGDEVKAGDILAVLTNADLDDEITDLEFDLWELDDTILDTGVGAKVTAVEASAAGRVMAIYAGVGDDALAVFRREGALAIISTDGRMKVELSDVDASAGVALNDKLTVTGEDFTAEGTVVDLTRQGTSLTLTIQDDSLPMGASVAVATMDGVTLGTATLEVNKPMAVSSYGGTIESVHTQVGKNVKRGETLFKLTDSPITLKLENLRLQRETANKSLEEAKEQRENLIVIAPCDGAIATLNVSEGDEITNGALIGSILEGEDMNLTIAVDELDVVEVAVGQKVSSVLQLVDDLAARGAMEYTVVVNSGASDSAALQYIAPYAGCTLGEYFMNKGRDVLIVYDDLSKHAVAYRTLSLLLERSPGREAYPGDVFYLHSRLLERAAHLSDARGGGSMTALPIVETQAGDVSAYIPTNIISITDGQIFLENSLFFSGQRPAVNVGLSVSRVGSAAQTKALKSAVGTLRLDLSQYREMEVFTQFSNDLDESTQKKLTYGKGLMYLLRQQRNEPLSQFEQTVLLTAALGRVMTDIPFDKIEAFKKGFLAYIEEKNPELHALVKADTALTAELKDKIVALAQSYKASAELR